MTQQHAPSTIRERRTRTAAAMAAVGVGAVTALGTVVLPAPASAATRYCADVSPLSQRPDLRQGDDGWCVQELQSRLTQRGYPVAQTHSFGAATTVLVKKFQAANRLPATGVVDRSTWLKLVGATQEDPPYSATSPYQVNRGPNRTSRIVIIFDDCPNSLTQFKAAINAAQALHITVGLAATGQCQRGSAFDASYARAHGQFVIGHSRTHPDLRRLSPAQMAAQIDPASAASGYMRPPFGEYTAAEARQLASRGLAFWGWTYDSADWIGETQAQVVDRIVTGAHAGDTVLAHMSWNAFNPSALGQIKSGLGRRGLTLCQAYVGKSAPVKLPQRLPC